jgi:hypothetical protein
MQGIIAMTDPTFWLTISAAGLIGLGLTLMAALSGWRAWIDLQRAQIDRRGVSADFGITTSPSPAARIELADLKERIRKLEAIAAGVDL